MVCDSSHRWLLCTGQPGSGKTTVVVRRLYEALSEKGVILRGFYTDEVLDKPGGTRIGFDIVTIPNEERGILSRKRGLPTTFPRTGAYVVDVDSFESLALPSIACPSNNNNNNKEITVIVIDEIGRMELHSHAFRQCILQLLASPSVRVIGAVTSPIYGHRVPFCDDITSRPEVSVRRITKKNRDAVYNEMLTEVLSLAGVV